MVSGAHYRFNSQAKKIQDNRVGCQKVGPTYGFTTSPEVDLGTTVDTLQTEYPYIQALSQDREWGVHCHVPCSTGPCFLVKVRSEAGTCLVAPVPVPCWEGLWCHCVSYVSEPCLSVLRVPALSRILQFHVGCKPQA
jgi:hypothetical protein